MTAPHARLPTSQSAENPRDSHNSPTSPPLSFSPPRRAQYQIPFEFLFLFARAYQHLYLFFFAFVLLSPRRYLLIPRGRIPRLVNLSFFENVAGALFLPDLLPLVTLFICFLILTTNQRHFPLRISTGDSRVY